MKKIFIFSFAFILVVLLSFVIIASSMEVDAASVTNIKSLNDIRKVHTYIDNTGYGEKADITGITPITEVYIQGSDNSVIKGFNSNVTPSYQFSNSSYIEFHFKTILDKNSIDKKISGTNYYLSSDSYGKERTSSYTPKVKTNYGEADIPKNSTAIGEIGTGAVIIEKGTLDSSGKRVYERFSSLDKLYTTDYIKNYGKEDKVLYKPEGDSLSNSVYFSINFYYELYYKETVTVANGGGIAASVLVPWLAFIPGVVTKQEEQKRYFNVREEYSFLLQKVDLNTVTITNITTTLEYEQNKKEFEDGLDGIEDKQTKELFNDYYYLTNNILNDNDLTTSGFHINGVGESGANISVTRNGSNYESYVKKNDYYEITEEGKYEIKISSPVDGSKRIIRIYVLDKSKASKNYLGGDVLKNNIKYGDYFLDYSPDNKYNNKRIFDADSDIPVFGGGQVTLHLKKAPNNYLPLHGKIINLSTNVTYDIDELIDENGDIVIDESKTNYGIYQVILYTKENYLDMSSENLSGEVLVYKYNFKLVKNLSHPSVNKKLLETGIFKDFSFSDASSFKSEYYGVARFTADKGQVIIAFSNENDAISYAEKVALGNVEVVYDELGVKKIKTYVVSEDGNISNTKHTFTNGFMVADEINKLKYAMVEKRYFDSSDPYSMLTLNKTYIDICDSQNNVSEISFDSFNEYKKLNNISVDDIKNIDLYNTVIIWYDETQKNQSLSRMIDLFGDKIAIIGETKNYYLSNQEEILSEENDFCFIKDSLGIESNSISAKKDNKIINIKYNESLYKQLKDNNISSGLIEIEEKNIYGVSTKYKVYLVDYPDKNMNVSINAKVDGASKTIQTNKYNNINEKGIRIIEVDCSSFEITNIKDLVDPNSIALVDDGKISYYKLSDIFNMKFTEHDSCSNINIIIVDRFANVCYLKLSFK